MTLVTLKRDIEFILSCSMKLGKLSIHGTTIALDRQKW